MTMMPDWLSPLAIATFVLAVAAFWAIWQTRSIQKGEKRRTLLNGIIHWAVDVIHCIGVTRAPYSKEDKLSNVPYMLRDYKAVDAERDYVINVSAVFGEDLHSTVIQVTNTLTQYIGFLEQCLDGHSVDDKVLIEWEEALSTYARTLIQKAAKIGANI